MNRLATVLLALSVLLSPQAYSQFFQSTNFKEGSGLPSSESYMVYQDSRGFVWIATDNGVVKYDGHEFVTYNTANGLTDNTVFGFFEDFKGRIWFRTYNGNLSYYENDSIKAYKYNKELKSFISSSILSTIRYDSADELHFSTVMNALTGKIDSAGNVASKFGTSYDDKGVMKSTDEHGVDWYFFGYVVDKAISMPWQWARQTEKIRIDDHEFSMKLDDELTQNNWLIGSVKWRGKYYFTIHKNIFTYDGHSLKKVFTADHSFISLYVDQRDRLWAGYFNNGVQMFTDESLSDPFSLEALSELSVSSVMQDYEGGMWVSTLDQGVFYFPNLTILNYSPPNNTRVSAVAYGENEVFLGNYAGEVFSMTDKGTTRLVTNAVAPVSNLFVDSEHKLWISDGSGTHIHQTGAYINGRGPKARAFKSLIEAKGYVIGCTTVGMLKMALNGDVISAVRDRRRPTSMTITDDAIYMGGLSGLDKQPLDLNGQSRRVGEGRISSLLALDNRFIAVGTISQGLFLYDSEEQTFTALPVADVVNIYSVISDWPERLVWIGTDKGLFQLDFMKDTTNLILDHFSKADGLISNKINKLCRMGDNIWAISDLGISSVPLGHFGVQSFVPKFYINRILFRNQSLTVNSPVVRTEEEDMVMDVRSITFKNYHTVFRYRVNEDQPWRLVTGGSIFLADMKPDDYRIEIQAFSGGYDWTKSLTVQLEVMAKWWETWTFRLSAVCAILALGYLGYRLRISAIRRRQKYLELINLHQQKLIDSEIRTQERERKRIATDLHDGIGASLSSIKIQIADVASNDNDDRETRAKEINENLTDVIDDIKRIVYDLHPPGLERYGLHSGLKSMVDRLNKTADINVIFDYYGQREVVQSISITIFRIIQELINNTLKHARASEIRIHINEFDDEINIMYEDNGIGMIGSRFTGLGLHSIESRVRSLNGRMSWESNHKGTFYNFDIPF